MACSDNVLRAGLTPKHISPGELLNTVIFQSMQPEIIRPAVVGMEQRFSVPVDDFELSIVRLQQGDHFPAGMSADAELLYCLKGEVSLTNELGESWLLAPATSVLLPAASTGWQLSGYGKIARVRIRPSLMH